MNAKSTLRIVQFVLLSFLFSGQLISQAKTNKQVSKPQVSKMTAEKIANKTYEAYKYFGDDRITLANMDIKNGKGETIMEREFVLMRKNGKNLEQKWYAYFKEPADMRKMVFMVWKHEDKDDDRWIYLPAKDLVKRLAGSDKRSSFAGSHFVYEDVTGRYPSMDSHELLSENKTYYEIKSTPKDLRAVEFAYFITYVDRKTFIPMHRIFYDKDENKQREYKVEKTEVIETFPTITQFSMTNLQTGESTYTTYSDIRYNTGVPENIFTEAYLRRTPRKWLTFKKR